MKVYWHAIAQQAYEEYARRTSETLEIVPWDQLTPQGRAAFLILVHAMADVLEKHGRLK